MRIAVRLLIGLLLLLLLLVGAAALFLANFDPNAHKDTLIARVKAATGRDLTLTGPIEFDVWPVLRLQAGALALGNAPGFGDEPMIALDELRLAVATLPLLRGQVEMETAKVTGLAINLARNAAGVTNWDDLQQSATTKTESPSSDRLGAVILGGVDITNARFHWRDEIAGRDILISDISARSGPLAFGTPIELALTAKVLSSKPAINGDLALTSTATYDPDTKIYTVDPLRFTTRLKGKSLPGGQAEIVSEAALTLEQAAGVARISKLSISGLDHQANGEITLDHLNAERPGARGHVEISGKDLGTLFRALELPAAAQIAKLKERGFAFKSEFEMDMASGKLSVPTFGGQFLGATLDGTLSGERVNTDTPALQGRLAAKGPDFPMLLVLGTQLMNPDEKSAASLARALANVKAKAFSFETEFTADLAAGQLELPRLEAQVLGNELKGALKSKGGSAGKPVVAGEITATGPDLAVIVLAIGALQGLDSAGLRALDSVLAKRPDRKFSLRTTVDVDLEEDRVALPAITATLFGNELTGTFRALAATTSQPAMDGEFAARGADLPALLALLGGLQGAGSSLPAIADSLATAEDKSFTFGGKFAADLKEGRFTLPSLGARALGLTLDGTLNATAFNHPSGGVIEGRVGLQGTQLTALLTALGQAELAKSIRALTFEAGLKGNAQTLALRPFAANVTVVGPGGSAPVDLKLTVGSAEANLERETLAVKDVALTGLGLNVKGALDATGIKSSPAYSGRLSVPTFNLREVLATLNKPVTDVADPAALTQVGLETTLQGSPTGYALPALTVRLDDSTVQGDIAVKHGDNPDIVFNLKADRLNADRYLAPKGESKAKPVTPEAAAAGAAQLPVETLRKVKVDGKFAVGNLQFSGLKVANVALVIKGRDGRLGLDPVTADLYGGRYTGLMSLDATGNTPKLAINTTLAKVAIEPLLADLSGKSDLAGTLNFEAKLNTLGGDSTQVTRSLNGPASFSITDGEFRGVDIPAILKTAELLIESKSLPAVPRGGVTRFQSLTGSLDIQNGAMFNRDLLLDGLGFKVSGEGMLANLVDKTIKYDARVTVDQGAVEQGAERYNLGDYVIPIRCRGEISGTSCLPDFGELAKRAATDAVKDKLKETLEDSGAGKALKNLLKF